MAEDSNVRDLNTPELETLARYLDAYRGAIVWKLDGVDEEAARRPAVPSGTSLLGLVKHLGYVERYWFQQIIAGRDVPIPWRDRGAGHDERERNEWQIPDDETIADVVAFYEQEIAESRRIHDALTDPDQTIDDDGDQVSVRRILIHMVEEVARHAGHADIIRELIDGTTGQFPDRQ